MDRQSVAVRAAVHGLTRALLFVALYHAFTQGDGSWSGAEAFANFLLPAASGLLAAHLACDVAWTHGVLVELFATALPNLVPGLVFLTSASGLAVSLGLAATLAAYGLLYLAVARAEGAAAGGKVAPAGEAASSARPTRGCNARRCLFATPVVVLALFTAAHFTFASIGAGRLTQLKKCGGGYVENTPHAFQAREDPGTTDDAVVVNDRRYNVGTAARFDLSPFWVPAAVNYSAVTYTSRVDGRAGSAWWVPAGGADGVVPNGRAVVFVHGKTTCKGHFGGLANCGMLWREGYACLVIEVRNHGADYDAARQPRSTLGDEEWRDVAGGWDWLRAHQGFSAEHLGVAGVSMGATASAIAMGQEPRLRAAWLDSPVCDTKVLLADEFGQVFGTRWGAMLGATALGSVYASDTPLVATEQLARAFEGGGLDRHVFVLGTTGDLTLAGGTAQMELCAAAAEAAADGANNATAAHWWADDVTDFKTGDSAHVDVIVPLMPNTPRVDISNTHTEAVLYYTAEYREKLVAFFDQSLA